MIGLCCSAVAIHEADEILSRGFEDQIYKVLKHFAMISSKLLRPTYIKQFGNCQETRRGGDDEVQEAPVV